MATSDRERTGLARSHCKQEEHLWVDRLGDNPEITMGNNTPSTSTPSPAADITTEHPPTSSSTVARTYLPLIFGQLIAFLAALMNMSSFTLAQKFNVETQFFQLFWVYLMLSTNLLIGWKSADAEALPTVDDTAVVLPDTTTRIPPPSSSHRLPIIPGNRRLLLPWWIYFSISVLDVIPNYLSLASFRYTSLTSTTLLGSLTVPSTMFFCRIFLAKTFRLHQYMGVILCVVGGALTIYQDTSSYGSINSSIGDVFALAAAVIYGLGDAVAEYSVKKMDRFEYLGMIGLFGMILTCVTIPFAERQAVVDLLFHNQRPWAVAGIMTFYISTVSLYYVSASRFLVTSDATLLNLSLQSVNLWAVGFTWLTQLASFPSSLFFVALLLVVLGVCLYEAGHHKPGDDCCCRCPVFSCRRRTRSESETEIVSWPRQPNGDYDTIVVQNTRLV